MRLRINPKWRIAHCFQSKYFKNQARYEKSLTSPKIDNFIRFFKQDNKKFCCHYPVGGLDRCMGLLDEVGIKRGIPGGFPRERKFVPVCGVVRSKRR
jgi:hypothetical protein